MPTIMPVDNKIWNPITMKTFKATKNSEKKRENRFYGKMSIIHKTFNRS